MQSSLLNQQIDIFRSSATTNNYGEQILSFTKVATYKGRIETDPSGFSRSFKNNNYESDVRRYVCILPINANVKATDIVKYENQEYKIKDIHKFRGINSHLELYLEKTTL